MATSKRKAKIRESGKLIEVYQHSIRGTWIDASNCKDEYKQEEIIFTVTNQK